MPGGRSHPLMLSAALVTALTLMAGCGSGGGPAANPAVPAPVPPTASPSASPTTAPSPTATTSRPGPTAAPSTPTSPPSAPAARTYFAQYGASTHAYKPHRLEPSVDGSLSVGGMHWHVWNDQRALGDGVAHVNDCQPDCADGHFSTHPVTVYLSRPRELCGSEYFTMMRLSGPDYRTRSRWSGIGCL